MDYLQPLSGFFEKASTVVPQFNFVSPDFSSLNQSAFKNAVPNIPTMDEHQIACLVKNNIAEITDDITSGNIPYIHLFSNYRFLDGFIRAIGSIPIDIKTRLACNRLAYDYFTSDNPVPEIKAKFLGIAKVVNHTENARLMALGLDENTASNLTLCRYSSPSEITNIKRLNFTMYFRDPNVFTEQMIVSIYEKLVDRASPLFYGMIFEVYTEQQEEEYGDTFMEIYGRVGLATLDILNNMSSDNIQKIILGYLDEYAYKRYPPVRFSLRALSIEYSHISRVVENMIASGKNIP